MDISAINRDMESIKSVEGVDVIVIVCNKISVNMFTTGY